MRMRVGITLFLALLAGCTTHPKSTTPTVKEAWVRAADSSATTAGYLTLVNPGATELAVVTATGLLCDELQMHETLRDGEVMHMRESSRLVAPPRGELVFAPGSNHFMLIGLRQRLEPGMRARFTLLLEDGGTIPVDAEVRL